MIWKRWKKLAIPLIIGKIVILVIFIFSSDTISISREASYNSSLEGNINSDSTVQRRQKLIRIVRNEDERGFSIILRAKKK